MRGVNTNRDGLLFDEITHLAPFVRDSYNRYIEKYQSWMYPAIASRDVVIHKNDRICQFRIVRNRPEINFCEVEELKGENRGGFRSSGTR